MDISAQIEILSSLVAGCRERNPAILHDRICKVRALIGLLGEQFYQLDMAAFEIETISSTILGLEETELSDEDFELIENYIDEISIQISAIKMKS